MCVLCRDTFSRSDILKRHFQKCSLRRGNPTGATHLSHPQAHLKRSQATNATKPIQDEVSKPVPPSTMGHAGMAFSEGGQVHPGCPWMAAPNQNTYLMQPGPNPSLHQQLNVDRSSFEQVNPPVVHDPNKRPVMPGANPNHASEIDWTSMFQTGPSDGYMNPVFPHSMASGQEPIHAHVDADRKFYPASTGPQEGGGMNGLYLASTTLSGDGTHIR